MEKKPGTDLILVHTPGPRPPEEILLWWTSQGDCEGIIRYHEDCHYDGSIPWGGPIPKYIWDNLRSRYGRNGRGTVWGHGVDTEINERLKRHWDFSNDFHRYINHFCGGVPFVAADSRIVYRNQGFVTDLNLKLLLEGE